HCILTCQGYDTLLELCLDIVRTFVPSSSIPLSAHSQLHGNPPFEPIMHQALLPVCSFVIEHIGMVRQLLRTVSDNSGKGHILTHPHIYFSTAWQILSVQLVSAAHG